MEDDEDGDLVSSYSAAFNRRKQLSTPRTAPRPSRKDSASIGHDAQETILASSHGHRRPGTADPSSNRLRLLRRHEGGDTPRAQLRFIDRDLGKNAASPGVVEATPRKPRHRLRTPRANSRTPTRDNVYPSPSRGISRSMPIPQSPASSQHFPFSTRPYSSQRTDRRSSPTTASVRSRSRSRSQTNRTMPRSRDAAVQRRQRSLSPPPSPPPPPPIVPPPSQMPLSLQSARSAYPRRNALSRPSSARPASTPGVGRDYAQQIATRAQEHRQASSRRSDGVLAQRIVTLEDALQRHQTNEKKLQDVNRRLQDRLIVFQQQNAENVVIAKQRIAELQLQIQRVQAQRATPSPARPAKSPRSKPVLRNEAEIQYMERLQAARRIFQQNCQLRRRRELASRLFRAWAAAVLFGKLCRYAHSKRLYSLARKCLRAWAQSAAVQRAERLQRAQARAFHADRIRLRRNFQAWRRVAHAQRQDRSQVETQLLGRTFFAWRMHVQEHRERLLRVCFQQWLLVYMRTLRNRLRAYAVRDAVSSLVM